MQTDLKTGAKQRWRLSFLTWVNKRKRLQGKPAEFQMKSEPVCVADAIAPEHRPEKLQFNRGEQKTYILKMRQVFCTRDYSASRLSGLILLGVQYPAKISYTKQKLTRVSVFTRRWFWLGAWLLSRPASNHIFNLWMESLCSRAVGSHSGIKRGWFDLEIEVRKSFEMQDQFFNFSFEVIQFLQFYSFQYYFPF